MKSVSPDVIFNFVESSPIKKFEKDSLRKSINMKVEKEPFKKPEIKENLKDRVLPMIRCFNRFDLLKVDETDNEENDEEMEYIKTNKPKSKTKKKRNVKTNSRKQAFEKINLESESSEEIDPEIIKCKSCQKSHFPSKKFCRWSILRNGVMHKRAK